MKIFGEGRKSESDFVFSYKDTFFFIESESHHPRLIIPQ